MEALYRGRYKGFTAKHFHEHLARGHRFSWGYTWTKTFLHSSFGGLRRFAGTGEAARGASPQAAAPANARLDAAPALRRAQEDQSTNGSAASRRAI